MQSIASMTASDVISDAVLDEVFSEEDEIQKAKLLLTLEDKATELGVKSKFQGNGCCLQACGKANADSSQKQYCSIPG